MFDISFSELLVIGAIALIVIGPARLPGVARTVGHLLGRAQRYVSDVKADIRREVELDELRTLKEQMNEAAQTVHTAVQASVQEGEAALRATPLMTPAVVAPDNAASDIVASDNAALSSATPEAAATEAAAAEASPTSTSPTGSTP